MVLKSAFHSPAEHKKIKREFHNYMKEYAKTDYRKIFIWILVVIALVVALLIYLGVI